LGVPAYRTRSRRPNRTTTAPKESVGLRDSITASQFRFWDCAAATWDTISAVAVTKPTATTHGLVARRLSANTPAPPRAVATQLAYTRRCASLPAQREVS